MRLHPAHRTPYCGSRKGGLAARMTANRRLNRARLRHDHWCPINTNAPTGVGQWRCVHGSKNTANENKKTKDRGHFRLARCVASSSTRDELIEAMRGHIIAAGEVVGTYER